MQAHLILVIDSNSDLNSKFNLIIESTVKSITTADAYLIDTATGVILNAGTYTEVAELNKMQKDYHTADAMRRAKLESEKKVFAGIAKDISDFLANAK
jgi:hypothetical protein